MRTRDEAIAFIGAHEAFHFLRDSRQIPGRNSEVEADEFAAAALRQFRQTLVPGQSDTETAADRALKISR